MSDFDSLLIVSFGGPEGPDQVDDFLARIAEGKNIPAQRLEEVKQRYLSFGGISPANENNRKLLAQLRKEFDDAGLEDMPIYLGNRNSPPFIKDALLEMQNDQRVKTLLFITSPFASFSSCRQYLENIEEARQDLDSQKPIAEIHRLRHFYNHPLFIKIHTDAIKKALDNLPENSHILFSAHSLPLRLADNCAYTTQLMATCNMIMENLGDNYNWDLVYQSVSGAPDQWLGPDILRRIEELGKERQTEAILISPIGFLSSHMEVIFDLDTDAKKSTENLGLKFGRASTPQEDPRFASLILELVEERTKNTNPQFLNDDILTGDCPPNCCLPQKA